MICLFCWLQTRKFTREFLHIHHHIVIEQLNVREISENLFAINSRDKSAKIPNRKFRLIIENLCNGFYRKFSNPLNSHCEHAIILQYFVVERREAWIWLPIIIISNLHASLYTKFIYNSGININLLAFRIRVESELKRGIRTLKF